MTHYFLNSDHTFRECDLMEWADQFEEMIKENTKHVAEDIINDHHVSTVWLGLNHNYSDGPPLLFETMVFKGEGAIDIYMDRYATWNDAVEGHKKAMQWVLDGCKEDE